MVTFNRDQADLIEEVLETRAAADPGFLRAYQRERDRTQNGGFFVKNVENVQGDERDVIVFSTTLGRDRHGAFRRSFGVLGQTGGERRLNVAVTRAREKIVLITSMPLGDISDWLSSGRAPNKPRDYLRAYLDYAARMSSGDLEAARRSAARLSPRSPSRRHDAPHANGDGFVAAVEAHLRDLGYEPMPAAEGDAFGLDFAVEDPRTGLFGIRHRMRCSAPRVAAAGEGARDLAAKRAAARDPGRPPRVVLRVVSPPRGRTSAARCRRCASPSDEEQEMSGPKVVRVVTREEVEAICRRETALVQAAADELRRAHRRHGRLGEGTERAIADSSKRLADLSEAGRYLDLQKQAPQLAAFFKSETERVVREAVAVAEIARSRRRRIADAARSVCAALTAAGRPIPDALRDVAAKASVVAEQELETLQARGGRRFSCPRARLQVG